jgi:hypothetical protein
VQDLFDDAEVDRDGRLLVRCKDVPEGEADLAKPECLRAVLRHLRDAAGVRGVVLVQDRERAYGPRALAVLDALLSLARLLDQFAQRAPAPAFPGFTAREVEAVCARCDFRPAALFTTLRDRLLGDPAAFLEALRDAVASLERYDQDGCGACAAATAQDLRILLADLARMEGG